ITETRPSSRRSDGRRVNLPASMMEAARSNPPRQTSGFIMPVRHPFEDKLAADWPPEAWRNTSVLLAVSGGADSVALARAAAAIRQPGEGQLMIAHFNHRLRGAASDADEQFVGDLARQLGLPFQVARGDLADLPNSGGDGLE